VRPTSCKAELGGVRNQRDKAAAASWIATAARFAPLCIRIGSETASLFTYAQPRTNPATTLSGPGLPYTKWRAANRTPLRQIVGRQRGGMSTLPPRESPASALGPRRTTTRGHRRAAPHAPTKTSRPKFPNSVPPHPPSRPHPPAHRRPPSRSHPPSPHVPVISEVSSYSPGRAPCPMPCVR
jgi:hypothetical protein